MKPSSSKLLVTIPYRDAERLLMVYQFFMFCLKSFDNIQGANQLASAVDRLAVAVSKQQSEESHRMFIENVAEMF